MNIARSSVVGWLVGCVRAYVRAAGNRETVVWHLQKKRWHFRFHFLQLYQVPVGVVRPSAVAVPGSARGRPLLTP